MDDSKYICCTFNNIVHSVIGIQVSLPVWSKDEGESKGENEIELKLNSELLANFLNEDFNSYNMF